MKGINGAAMVLFIWMVIGITPWLGVEVNIQALASEEGHRHSPPKRKKDGGPAPGMKEVRIDLSGPFCDSHPREIIKALKAASGVQSVEAFKKRRYIMVQYEADHVAPDQMTAVLDEVKGEGWHCKGTVSQKRRGER